jgi:hypothetical protein
MNTRSWLEIGEEVEQPSGWAYRVARLDGTGQVSSTHTVRLSWVDHDQFSGGACRPSVVVEAVLDALIDAGFEDWPAVFDLSTARRWVPELRAAVQERL